MTTLEHIEAHAKSLFSELSADLTIERDRNNGKFWIKAASKAFAFHVEEFIEETATNFQMSQVVRGLVERFTRTLASGDAPRRISDVAVEPEPIPEPESDLAVPVETKADTDPAPAPESSAEPEQPTQ